MRTIKFRAKRVDNGKWAYGGLIQADDYCIIDQRNELYVERDYKFRGDTHFFQISGVMCDENTIGQFTGLHDKNGYEIYEGDILECIGRRTDNYGQRTQRIVTFDFGGFMLSSTDNYINIPLKAHISNGILGWYVIGNIHDNPEMLKGGSQ